MPKKPSSRRRPNLPPDPFAAMHQAMLDQLSNALDSMMDQMLGRLFNPTQPPPIPRRLPVMDKETKNRYKESAQRFAQRTQTQSQPKPTLYDLLGVSPYAPPEVIRGAWLALSKLHHPDRGGSEELIKKLNHAHDLLSDPEKRKKYDQIIGIRS